MKDLLVDNNYRGKTIYNIFLIDVTTNERKGPFPFATYICKNILLGGDRSVFVTSRIIPYRGYFIVFEQKQ